MDIPTIVAKKRAYWHIDAKWVFGLFFTSFLFLALPLYVLHANVFTNQNAKQIRLELKQSTNEAIRDLVPDLDSDFNTIYPKILENARKNQNKKVTIKIGDVTLALASTGSEILAMSKANVKEEVTNAFIKKALPQFSFIVDSIDDLPGIFSNISQSLRIALLVLLGLLVLFGLPYIIFSEKFKKLFSLGISLLFVTLPNYGIAIVLNNALAGGIQNKYITPGLVSVIKRIFISIVLSYATFLYLSLGLIIAGIVLQIIYGFAKRRA